MALKGVSGGMGIFVVGGDPVRSRRILWGVGRLAVLLGCEMCVVDVSAQSLAACWPGIIDLNGNSCGGNAFGVMVVVEITHTGSSSLIWTFK